MLKHNILNFPLPQKEKGVIQKRQFASLVLLATLCLAFLVICVVTKDYKPEQEELGELLTVSGSSVAR